jgi:DNA-directed RNA polymerase specialized sigma24 family protein
MSYMRAVTEELAAAEETEDGSAFCWRVSPHVAALSHYVRHILACAKARGKLGNRGMSPLELVEQTLLRGYEEFQQRPPARNIASWLNRLAVRELEDQVRRSRRYRRVVY